MKRRALNNTLMFILFAAIFLPLHQASALPRTGRLVEGPVQNVNHSRRSAEVFHEGEWKIITWSNRVKVFRNSVETTSNSLRNGDHVSVWRRVPLFGPPFVRRITIHGSAAP